MWCIQGIRIQRSLSSLTHHKLKNSVEFKQFSSELDRMVSRNSIQSGMILKFSKTIKELLRSPNYPLGYLMLDRIISHNLSVSGTVFDAILLSYCEHKIEFDQGMKLFRRMKEIGVLFTAKSHENMMKLAGASKNVEAKDLAEVIEDCEAGAGQEFWYVCLKTLIAHNQMDLFEKYQNRLEMDKENGLFYDLQVYKNSKTGYLDGGLKVFDEMKKEGVEPSKNAYNFMIRLCGSDLSGLDKVKNVYQEAIASKSSNIAFLTEMVLVIKNHPRGLMSDAWDVLDDLKRLQISADPRFFSVLVQTIQSKGTMDDLLRYLDEIRLCKVQPNVSILNDIIAFFIEKKDHRGSERFFRSLLDSGLDPDRTTFTKMIPTVWLKDNPSINSVKTLYDLMLECKIEPDEYVMNVMLTSYAKCPDSSLEEAFEYFHENIKKLKEPNVILYESLLNVCASKGDSNKVVEVIEMIKQAGFTPRPIAFNIILKTTISTLDFQSALDLFYTIKNGGLVLDTASFNSILSMLSKSKGEIDFDVAQKLYREMRNMQISPNNRTFTSLLNIWNRNPDKSQRKAFISHISDAIVSDKSLVPDEMLFWSLVTALIKCDDHERFLKMIKFFQERDLTKFIHVKRLLVLLREFPPENKSWKFVKSYIHSQFKDHPTVSKKF
jgi:pentatricopeptide repeat protein